jgi:hypothetical protein
MSLADLKNIVETNKENIALIKAIKDKYNDFLLSDQFKEDKAYNSNLFYCIGEVLAFIKSHNQLTHKNLVEN